MYSFEFEEVQSKYVKIVKQNGHEQLLFSIYIHSHWYQYYK